MQMTIKLSESELQSIIKKAVEEKMGKTFDVKADKISFHKEAADRPGCPTYFYANVTVDSFDLRV